MRNSAFIELLKEHTSIDEDFIDTFFKKFKIGGELDFHLKDVDVAKYLQISLKTLRDRLLNIYSKEKYYIENFDYVKIKTKNTSGITYMLNYQCFERIAMSGYTKEAEAVRNYFVKLRMFLVENQKQILRSLTNKDELKKYEGCECIYFLQQITWRDFLRLV